MFCPFEENNLILWTLWKGNTAFFENRIVLVTFFLKIWQKLIQTNEKREKSNSDLLHLNKRRKIIQKEKNVWMKLKRENVELLLFLTQFWQKLSKIFETIVWSDGRWIVALFPVFLVVSGFLVLPWPWLTFMYAPVPQASSSVSISPAATSAASRRFRREAFPRPHSSNRLPRKSRLRDSSFSFSHISVAPSWQSARAVVAHEWKLSQ